MAWCITVSIGTLFAAEGIADVSLPGLFSDNMVLQQKTMVPIWGWAESGEQITVRFQGRKAKTVAKDGKWMVKMGKFRPGGPEELVIEGKNKIVFTNVLVGEVWVCSGQSNMEWPLSRAYESQGAIASSQNSSLRLFTVPKLKANEPTNNVNASWQECRPGTVTNFSAVAYYFGRELQKALQAPVGLIHTSWGGSPAEVWMSKQALESSPEYQAAIVEKYKEDLNHYEDARAKFEEEQAEAKKRGETSDKKAPQKPFWKPTELYDGMIAPLIPYAIKGAIWYQGESNAGRADQYRRLFPDMIRNWRRDWGLGDFPFLAVQLAPWDKGKKRSIQEITASPGDSDWAELREAQVLATKKLKKVGIAVITDVGDKDDIHPTKKEPVGARLALAARSIAYGQSLVSSGPTLKKMEIKGKQAVLTFNNVGRGLDASGSEVKGFAIAGPDRKFVWANARIVAKDKIEVSSPDVPNPVAVRYGWADYPVVNLTNIEGLPASPFRTDDYPMITAVKK